jgi:hypothetical protein
MPTVGNPLINTSGHVEQTERIWNEGAYWRGLILVKW